MSVLTLDFLTQRLELADELRAEGDHLLEPQDLPGRFGRAIRAIDHILSALACPAVVAGGWAVWRHGYVGRVTEDVEIVLPADRIEEFFTAAALSGFERLPVRPGNWPKVRHKESDIKVDILPEGATPGTAIRLAPTQIPHPDRLGPRSGTLNYIDLAGLVELKLAAARSRDDSDVVELIRANPAEVASLRRHLLNVHPQYAVRFDELLTEASELGDH